MTFIPIYIIYKGQNSVNLLLSQKIYTFVAEIKPL